MLILDEARLFSRSSHVRRKIRDWLKTLRKQNVSDFATNPSKMFRDKNRARIIGIMPLANFITERSRA